MSRAKPKVRRIGDRLFYRGQFVCKHLRARCFLTGSRFNMALLYNELSRTEQLEKFIYIDRYYLYFRREYPVDKFEYDNLVVCKDCWKDFLMYRLAREGVAWEAAS